MTRLPFALWVLPFTLLLISGCYGPQVAPQLGWTTTEVRGALTDAQGDALSTPGFIVVQEYFGRVVPATQEAPLYAPQARLVFPNPEGQFRFDFDLRASQLEMTFVAAEREMQTHRFQRQLGVGTLVYEITLEPAGSWDDHFLLQVAPFLERFILEQRYQMPEAQQLFLGEWMDQQRQAWTSFQFPLDFNGLELVDAPNCGLLQKGLRGNSSC
jgi:hypothetical protein